MDVNKKVTSLALAVSLVAAQFASAQTAPQSDAEVQREMLQEIRDLKARLAQVESELKDVKSHDEKATSAAVNADAEKRSEVFDPTAFNIHYKDGKLLIRSEDGNFLVHPWLHLQVRDTVNWREMGGSWGRDNTQNGIEIRRARFGIDGNVFSPDMQYFLNWATARGNGTTKVTDSSGKTIGTTSNNLGGVPQLEEAWALYHFHDTDWSIRAGQMHDPLDHEAIIGSKMRYPEASLQTEIFANVDTFTQAITAVYDPKNDFRFEGGITDGIRAANTNFQDYPSNSIAYDWGVAGRAEYKFFGDWNDYKILSARGDKHELLVAGLGMDESEGGQTDTFSHTFDLQYNNPNGMMLYGAFFGRYITNNPGIVSGAPTSTNVSTAGTPGLDTYEWSVMAQAAYCINQKWEPYIRYEYLWLAGTPAGSNNAVHDISLGVNYYIYGNNVKLTSQIMYLPNGIPISDDSSDVLISNNKQEVIFMTQLQLLL